MLQLSTKCSKSAFNAQGSRLIIVVVHVRAVKKYVTSSGGAQEKGKTGWNSQFTTEVDGFLNFTKPAPPHANVLFCRFFYNLALCMTKLRVFGAVFFLL
jgi:hypothetical protein